MASETKLLEMRLLKHILFSFYVSVYIIFLENAMNLF